MNSNKNISEMKDRKILLSTLWIFLTVNYIYCDVISLMLPETIKQIMTGNIGAIHITQGFMLGASILMELPMAMILLSRILKYGANRWVNIIAGSIMSVVQILSFLTGTAPTFHYIFFSTIEIACTLIIILYSWKWKNTDTNNTII
jgi:hypothetical protein